MKSFREIREARGDTCVFTFGRFNPPTTGHEKLLDKVSAVAKSNPGAPYYIFASHSENAKKDPLPYVKKVAYMKKMFPKHARNIVVDKARNVFEIAVSLYNKGHKAIVMVVGSDRVDEFNSLLNKYNGVEARHGYYGFDNIEVVSAGERDPDAEGVTGMSASKMRAAASANDFDQFKLGLPRGFSDGDKLFADVRKHMGIRESFVPKAEVITEEDIFRDMYVRGEILTIGEIVTDSYSGVSGKIIRRGTNYLTFAEEDGTTHKKWLYELQEQTMGQLIKHIAAKSTHRNIYAKALDVLKSVIDRKKKENNGKLKHDIVYYAGEIGRQFRGVDARELAKAYETQYESVTEGKQDKDIKDKKGTQPAKYYAKDAEGDEMAKSTKDKRDAHFRKGAEKDDDDKSAYKPAPGDATAKTKPSQYTNKMKKKFPDLYKEGVIDKILKKVKGLTPQQMAVISAIPQPILTNMIGQLQNLAMGESSFYEFIDNLHEGAADTSLAKKAEASGISVSILKQVYNRGVAAWKGGHRPGTTPEQWGHARVNSFISGGKTRTTADADLWKKHKGVSEEEDPREIGTDARREALQGMTPGQEVEKYTVSEGLTMVVKHGKKKYQLGDGQKIKMFGKEYSSVGVTKQQVYVVKGPDGERVFSKKEFEALLKKGDIEIIDTGSVAQFERFSFKEHLNCGTPNCCNECETSSLIESNQYRVGSEKYFEFFQEKRDAYNIGVYKPVGFDKELMEGDIGKMDYYQGQPVPLDCPMMFEEKDVELNKPKVGGPKKYYVYVKDPSTGNVKKVTFGDTTGLKVKLDDPEARKNFAARHNCDQQKDKTKAGYWSCNLPRYAKQLGLSGGGNFYW